MGFMDEKLYQMKVSKIYPLLVAKAERKGRTREEVDEIISWMTGYSCQQLESDEVQNMAYGDFFRYAPCPNPGRYQITGTVCGVRVEQIEDPILREIRYLDKLVDELAKGKAMEKILPDRKNSRDM